VSADAPSRQLPSSMVAREFGEVNVRRAARGEIEVNFTILMEPDGDMAEGWQTGVALDASNSMKGWYGQGLRGCLPPHAEEEYKRKGWMQVRDLDGRSVQSFKPEAYEDAIKKGHLFRTPNIIEPLARDFISYLAGNLDEDGGTTVVYWACDDGAAYEVVGDYTTEQVRTLSLAGPKKCNFGTGTRLLPVVRYFVDRFKDAKRGMYVFLTDGRLDDLGAVKSYTTGLCRDIAQGKRNMVKCVLIGVGEQIEERQMVELDDLDSGTEVDVWDHKIAREMRGLVEIFAEVVDENTIVAPTARLFDASGQLIKQFSDGLPAKVSFRMSGNSPWFELEVGGERVRQSVIEPR